MERKLPELTAEQYRSVGSDVDCEQTLQRSRFIASLRRVKNREAFELFLKEIAATYPKASHYCWAYRFHAHPILEHASDAGEPAGTAGRPILGALKQHGLSNVMAVVTRYYGGVKLGVKGLIAAYGDTVRLAVAQSKIVVYEPSSILSFTSTYDFYNILLSRLEKHAIPQENLQATFAADISGEISIRNSTLPIFLREIEGLSQGQGIFSYSVREGDECFT